MEEVDDDDIDRHPRQIEKHAGAGSGEECTHGVKIASVTVLRASRVAAEAAWITVSKTRVSDPPIQRNREPNERGGEEVEYRVEH